MAVARIIAGLLSVSCMVVAASVAPCNPTDGTCDAAQTQILLQRDSTRSSEDVKLSIDSKVTSQANPANLANLHAGNKVSSQVEAKCDHLQVCAQGCWCFNGLCYGKPPDSGTNLLFCKGKPDGYTLQGSWPLGFWCWNEEVNYLCKSLEASTPGATLAPASSTEVSCVTSDNCPSGKYCDTTTNICTAWTYAVLDSDSCPSGYKPATREQCQHPSLIPGATFHPYQACGAHKHWPSGCFRYKNELFYSPCTGRALTTAVTEGHYGICVGDSQSVVAKVHYGDCMNGEEDVKSSWTTGYSESECANTIMGFGYGYGYSYRHEPNGHSACIFHHGDDGSSPSGWNGPYGSSNGPITGGNGGPNQLCYVFSQASCKIPPYAITTTYDYSEQRGDFTIKNFNPSGVQCSPGATGTVTYTVCSAPGQYYGVSGCHQQVTHPSLYLRHDDNDDYW